MQNERDLFVNLVPGGKKVASEIYKGRFTKGDLKKGEGNAQGRFTKGSLPCAALPWRSHSPALALTAKGSHCFSSLGEATPLRSSHSTLL